MLRRSTPQWVTSSRELRRAGYTLMRWILLLAIVLIAGGAWFWWSFVPDQSGVYEVEVEREVRITFDQRGRPYVRAESFEDAFFAQGWLHARDRLWQMDMFRRAGSARLAALLGHPGLATDREIWRAGVPELAKRIQQTASSRLRSYAASYVAGINAWLETGERLPVEYLLLQATPERWQVDDVYSLGALMAYQSANNRANELVRLAIRQKLGEEKSRVFLPPGYERPVFDQPLPAADLQGALDRSDLTLAVTNPLFQAPALGSNSWAVAPARSETGTALFAFDSHDALGLPNLTYDVHLFVGDAQIRGTSVAGLLGVINGYNEFMAWGFTNIGDSQDLYLETVDDENPLRFKGRNGWYQADTQEVRIAVRDQPDDVLTLVFTENGRLISSDPPISERWAPLAVQEVGLDALLALNRATSFQAFNQAMDRFTAPSANVTYADTNGRIAQRTIGVLPVRGAGQGLEPLQGNVPGTEWLGVLPTNALPSETNPEAGVVFAANQPLRQGGALVSADNAPGYRTRRIADVLALTTPISVDDMQALQTDYVNLQAAELLPKMLDALDVDQLSDAELEARDRLSTWHPLGYDAAERAEPTLFAAWYQHFATALFREALGDELFSRLMSRSYLVNQAIDKNLLGAGADGWPVVGALRSSFSRAVQEVSDTPWGQVHQLVLQHDLSGAFPGSRQLFDRGPYAASGGNATVGRARYSLRRPFNVSGGATTRIVLSMSDPIAAQTIAPGGQSGVPMSPHYNDQTRAWIDGDYDLISDLSPEEGARILLKPR